MTTAVAAYHKYREARRDEDTKDRRSQLDDIRALIRVQAELEARISRAEIAAATLTKSVEGTRCQYPNSDGTARWPVPRLGL